MFFVLNVRKPNLRQRLHAEVMMILLSRVYIRKVKTDSWSDIRMLNAISIYKWAENVILGTKNEENAFFLHCSAKKL